LLGYRQWAMGYSEGRRKSDELMPIAYRL